MSESITLREKYGLKHNRPGGKKAIFESVAGDDLHRVTGKWNRLEREIDRENDRYRERIIDGESGEIIRQVDEPLSAHRDRGSAKRKAVDPPTEQ